MWSKSQAHHDGEEAFTDAMGTGMGSVGTAGEWGAGSAGAW